MLHCQVPDLSSIMNLLNPTQNILVKRLSQGVSRQPGLTPWHKIKNK